MFKVTQIRRLRLLFDHAICTNVMSIGNDKVLSMQCAQYSYRRMLWPIVDLLFHNVHLLQQAAAAPSCPARAQPKQISCTSSFTIHNFANLHSVSVFIFCLCLCIYIFSLNVHLFFVCAFYLCSSHLPTTVKARRFTIKTHFNFECSSQSIYVFKRKIMWVNIKWRRKGDTMWHRSRLIDTGVMIGDALLWGFIVTLSGDHVTLSDTWRQDLNLGSDWWHFVGSKWHYVTQASANGWHFASRFEFGDT